MSEILELFLEFVINLAAYVLEAIADVWLHDLTSSNTTAKRVFWCAAILLVVGVIWWELR
jgi:hypothetical protein